MLKKTSIALTSAGVLSLAAVKAHHISACDFELGNCTGYFYNDISAAFVDCYDANGVLASRKEAFYTSPLQKECNTTDGASFIQSLNGTNVAVPADITDMNNIEVCDYFSYGEGYQFSQANSGIGLVILGDRYNSTRDLFYQNGMPSENNSTTPETPDVPAPQLNWNWAELSGLIAQLQNVQCGVVNATTNVTTPINFGSFNLFAALNLPWAQWSQQAISNLDINSWSKADWKIWIQNYVVYWNAIQSYIAKGEAILNGAANGIEGAAGNLLGSYELQIKAGIDQARSILSQGALYISENIEIDGTAEFTQFWRPEFDLDTVSVADIKRDLSIVSNVVIQVEGWFTGFFINGGIDAILGQNTNYVIEGDNGETTSISTGTAENTVTLNVPNQVEAIVSWITANFNSELSSIFAQYNITFTSGSIAVEVNSTEETNSTMNETEGNNSTDNGTEVDNSTEETNSTDNGTEVDNNSTNNGTEVDNGSGSGNPGSIDLFVNYVLPEGCAFTDDSNLTVRCQSGNSRGVTFTIAQISEYFNTTALEVCSDYTQVFTQCESNTVISDLDTCLRLSLFNQFQLAQETVIYGWLSYDVVARNALFGRCQAEDGAFTGVSEQFSSGFTFDFPNIN